MDIIGATIRKPVTVAVGVILLIMFGLIGATAIPIQLAPNVDRPIITVNTNWPGRSPEEIIDRITKEQEERLKSVANLRTMQSLTREGAASITLEFNVGVDIGRALQEVSDALRQVPEYPADADEPTVRATEGSTENAIAWIMIELPADVAAKHPDFSITTLQDAIEKEVKPFLERIDGVALVNVFGGQKREARVLTEARALARHGLSYADLVTALQMENQNVSAGVIAEGKRDYRVRVTGQFRSADDVLNTIIAYRNGSPIYVRDVADVEIGYEKQRGFVRSNEGPAMAMNVIRQSGANVIKVMDELRERLDEVRERILPSLDPEVGPDLVMRQVYDETVYISSAIGLVVQNLWVGGSIAALVLLLFLRSIVATGVVALAIPISIIGTFLAMLAMGRTLNVISLAGLAFAVGMVVDNAIVVLENIDRRLGMGEPPLRAAYRGGKEVWGAVLASTLTTIAVFIPILTIREEAGQLFRDISLAIVSAVALSLIVSVTVIPVACSRWLHLGMTTGHHGLRGAWDNLFGLAPVFAKFADSIAASVHWLITGWRAWTLRPLIILGMTVASLVGSYLLAPPLDYLPAGNRNLVFGGLLIPPGYSLKQQVGISKRIETTLMPYLKADVSDPASIAALPMIPREEGEPFAPEPIKNFFIGAFNGGMFIGARSKNPRHAASTGQLLSNAMNSIPDAYGGARQASLFGRGASGGNTINLQISGPSLERVQRAAGVMLKTLIAKYNYKNVRPDPANFNLSQQELRVELTEEGRKLGLRTSDLGVAVRAFFDGAFVGDYNLNGDAIDMVVLPKNGRLAYKEQTASIPIVTPTGRVVPFDTVATVVEATAPQSIQRVEELPSVTLRITPPTGEALETVMASIRSDVISPAKREGLLDRSMRVRLEGTAAKLDDVKHALLGPGEKPGANTPARKPLMAAALLVLLGACWVGAVALRRATSRRSGAGVYGAVGAVLVGVLLASVLFLGAVQPHMWTGRLVWALVVTYLLMAALFESFVYPLVIMFTVPLAIVGGFAGLKIVHQLSMQNPYVQPQQLDVLTMLGFVILIGVVVNNAILLVHQTLNFMRGVDHDIVIGQRGGEPMERTVHDAGMPPLRAVEEAVRTRIRPIMMSTLTSVGGMAPLALFPGAGSELYRGLGSVVIGGLLVATIFTLILAPLLLSLTLQMSAGLREMFSTEERGGDGQARRSTGESLGAIASGNDQASEESETALQPA